MRLTSRTAASVGSSLAFLGSVSGSWMKMRSTSDEELSSRLPILPSANALRPAGGTSRSAKAAVIAKSRAVSAKSDSARVTCSRLHVADRSASAVTSATPSRADRNVAAGFAESRRAMDWAKAVANEPRWIVSNSSGSRRKSPRRKGAWACARACALAIAGASPSVTASAHPA